MRKKPELSAEPAMGGRDHQVYVTAENELLGIDKEGVRARSAAMSGFWWHDPGECEKFYREMSDRGGWKDSAPLWLMKEVVSQPMRAKNRVAVPEHCYDYVNFDRVCI